jgi:hypothetical protein
MLKISRLEKTGFTDMTSGEKKDNENKGHETFQIYENTMRN